MYAIALHCYLIECPTVSSTDLMELNFLASRSYNDITQYPVFPWVLTDYDAVNLNLNDPGIYRDLSRPIGALDPERARQLQDRYNSFPDDMVAFHHGTHYSSAALVCYYMIRMMPYTLLAVELQSA